MLLKIPQFEEDNKLNFFPKFKEKSLMVYFFYLMLLLIHLLRFIRFFKNCNQKVDLVCKKIAMSKILNYDHFRPRIGRCT